MMDGTIFLRASAKVKPRLVGIVDEFPITRANSKCQRRNRRKEVLLHIFDNASVRPCWSWAFSAD